jgi:hypothetical protein
MARVEKSIEVRVPVRTAYNQWTQFEEFPQFMEGVEEVRQLDDRHLYFRAKIGLKQEEWEAEIREQVPDQKIIWTAIDGAQNAGMVKFDSLGPDRTRVHLEMSYDPEGFVESVGDALGFTTRRIEGDLERFRDFIEGRGVETGGYRETLPNPAVPGGHTRGSLDAGEPGRSRGDQLRDPSSSGTYSAGQESLRSGQLGGSTSVESGTSGRTMSDPSVGGTSTPGAMSPGSLSREEHQRQGLGDEPATPTGSFGDLAARGSGGERPYESGDRAFPESGSTLRGSAQHPGAYPADSDRITDDDAFREDDDDAALRE